MNIPSQTLKKYKPIKYHLKWRISSPIQAFSILLKISFSIWMLNICKFVDQAISFSIAESLKKDVVPIWKYYIMVKLFEKLPKLVEKKKPIGNTFWNSRQGVVLFTFLSISWAIKTTFTLSYWLDISEQNMKQWDFFEQFLVIFNIWRWKLHPF